MRTVNLILLISALTEHRFASAFLTVAPSGGRRGSRATVWNSFKILSRQRSCFFATDNSNDGEENKNPKKKSKNKKPRKKKKLNKDEKKEAIGKATAKLLGKDKEPKDEEKKEGLLNMLDPFKAGRKVRKTIGSAISTLSSQGVSPERRSIYYLDDRFADQGGPGGALFSERNPLFDRLSGDDYVPEVLVVGATGEVGRLVVRRLLIDGRFRVRVLVRDLYSKTLNMLGTGVTYCQGDLSKVESLEYAITDVDKIVFCAGAPRLDEANFQDRFQEFVDENLENGNGKNGAEKVKPGKSEVSMSDSDWLELESVLELRAKLAEQVDYNGMKNLVRAYQNVRFADYGTSQAAKRSLFKFGSRAEDFNLFAIDGEDFDDEDQALPEPAGETVQASSSPSSEYGDYDDEDYGDYDQDDDDYYAAMNDKYNDMDDPYAEYEDEAAAAATRQAGASTKTQCKWVRNEFGHGVFVGKVPAGDAGGGGEAAIVSSRLRSSRDDPDAGIDLSNGFGGFVCRVCADGGTYEALVRTGAYETDGVEYVCDFSTMMKPFSRGNKSKNKFMTVRLDFANFKPVQTKGGTDQVVPPFRGQDVRQIGFRYRSASNPDKNTSDEGGKAFKRFYLALSYIKVYRSQPEPEFIYLSDARIPPVVESRMIRHKAKRLVTDTESSSSDDGAYRILDEAELKRVAQDRQDRSKEETYYKYRGEEILKSSGLSYTIIRVGGYNELPTADANTIELQSSNDAVTPVSRADVAQVCATALLDPNALNKSFYISKAETTAGTRIEQDLSAKFKSLPTDQ